MSATEAGPSRRRRQYASRACNACRRRRCKCDGVQPTCGTCATSGHECSWSTESDARRPATKQLVESLRVKIQVLEAEVARLKDQVSTPAETSSASPALFVEGSSETQQPPASARSTLDEPLISGDSGASGSQYSSPAERPHPLPPARSPSTPTNQFTATVTYKYIFQIDPSIPSSEQLTDTRLSLVCDWNRYLPTLEGIELTRLEHDTILSRCFKYGTSYLLALVPEIFLHDMLYALTSAPAHQSHTRLQHYSPMLHCAILSYASAFSDNEKIRSRATRDKFAQQAKQWLDEELKDPVMGLLRALALLADYHCGIGDRNTGYMYMGMSIRGARTMLARGERNHWVAQGVVTYPESVTREWHYWSIFAQDKLMALDFERMSDMPVQHAGVNLPAVDAELDSRSWPMNALDTTATSKSFPKITSLAFLESCKLMVIAARIIDATHSQGQAQEDGVVINLHLQLDTWFNNLPEVLIVWARTASPLPHVIMLHICYWSLLIHLHQPFYQRGTPSHAPAVDLSVKMCERATQKIVQFLNIFKIQHDLRFFPRNMLQAITVCGNALLMESAASPSTAAKKRATALEGVDACIRALRAISVTWPCAEQQAIALEARRNQQTPLSTTSMEVDELEDDLMEDLGDVKRVYHLAGQQPSRSQSHGLAVPQMVTSRPSERVPVRIKIRMFRPDTCGAEKGWDLALMKAFPVTWIA